MVTGAAGCRAALPFLRRLRVALVWSPGPGETQGTSGRNRVSFGHHAYLSDTLRLSKRDAEVQ